MNTEGRKVCVCVCVCVHMCVCMLERIHVADPLFPCVLAVGRCKGE